MAEYFNWITFQEVEKQEQKETRIWIEKALRFNWNIYRKCNGDEMILIASLLL